MALTDQEQQQTDKKPSPTTDNNQRNDKKEKQYTKVIIRRLPPTMDQETFLNQISPVPNYDYFYMVKGDGSLGENSFSRAYINFTNQQDIYDFKERFDNYVFLDSAGHEYPAVVEYAPFQKIPKRRHHHHHHQQQKRIDPKCNTIEQDSYYLEFVEMITKLAENDGASGEKLEYSYTLNENKNDEPTTTPLLEFLKKKHHERMRIREERREERKRREYERKKYREEEQQQQHQKNTNKKRYDDEKSPNKVKYVEHNDDDVVDEYKNKKTEENHNDTKQQKLEENTNNDKYERTTVFYKSRDKKYEKYDDKKRDMKNRYPKKDHVDKREFKSSNRRDDYNRDYNRSKYDDYNKNKDDLKASQQHHQQQQKKVKKYSEKREERKMEALKKLELEKQEQIGDNSKTTITREIDDDKASCSNETKQEQKRNDNNIDKSDKELKIDEKIKEMNETQQQTQKRIRNKDRPSIAIYRPGMLSKRKQAEQDVDIKDNKKE